MQCLPINMLSCTHFINYSNDICVYVAIFNFSVSSRICHPEMVMDSAGKCCLPCISFSCLPSVERQYNLIIFLGEAS